jgi:hypothetical protein
MKSLSFALLCAASAASSVCPSTFVIEKKTNYKGGTIISATKNSNQDDCCASCAKNSKCVLWVFDTEGTKKEDKCSLWSKLDGTKTSSSDAVAGVDSGSPTPPPAPTPSVPTPSSPTPTPATPTPAPPPTPGSPPFASTWFRSDTTEVNVTYPTDPVHGKVFRWQAPKKPTVVMTYFPTATKLPATGGQFSMKVGWKSSGLNQCDPFDWQDGKTCSCGQDLKEKCEAGKGTPSCARSSVNCIEGTGDFRIALWDTKSNAAPHETKDGFLPKGSGDDMHA